MLRGILLFALGAIIVVGGVVGYQMVFAGSASNSNSTADSAAARDQFLNDRGGAVVTGTNGLAGGGAGGAGFAGGGVVGTVDSIDNNTIKVTSFNSSTTTITLASDAKISKSISGTIADVKVGDQISIVATQNGNTLTAASVQIGGATGMGGAMGMGGGRGANASGTPGVPGARANRTPGTNAPGTGAGAGAAMTPVNGTVQSVGTAAITVKAADGTSTTVTVDATTQYRSQQTITLADVKVGDTVVATGAMNGDTFAATALEVGAMNGFGAPGGAAGPGGAPGAGPLVTPTP